MAAEQAALRRRIAEKRTEIAEDIDRLRDELLYDYKTATNPNALMARRPLLSVGLALGLGLFVGYRVAGSFVPPPPSRPRVERAVRVQALRQFLRLVANRLFANRLANP